MLRATRALGERVPDLRTGRFTLTKRLPVGAGIGGGSSDAAAALRLLARLNDIPASDERLHDAARATGADVPVCLDPRARMMRGTGDRLGTPLTARPLLAVLANPGVHLETKAVFGKMGLKAGQEGVPGQHPDIHDGLDEPSYFEGLARGRNDMEAAAAELAPAIPAVLAALRAVPGCRLARMSGSGSTCFGLFGDRTAARRGATKLGKDHPEWWVKATALR